VLISTFNNVSPTPQGGQAPAVPCAQAVATGSGEIGSTRLAVLLASVSFLLLLGMIGLLLVASDAVADADAVARMLPRRKEEGRRSFILMIVIVDSSVGSW